MQVHFNEKKGIYSGNGNKLWGVPAVVDAAADLMAAADVVPPNVVAVEVFVVHVVADLLFGWLSNDLQNQANYFGCYVLA